MMCAHCQVTQSIMDSLGGKGRGGAERRELFPARVAIHLCLSPTASVKGAPVRTAWYPSSTSGCRNNQGQAENCKPSCSGKRPQVNRWKAPVGLLHDETEGARSNDPSGDWHRTGRGRTSPGPRQQNLGHQDRRCSFLYKHALPI